MSDVFISYKAEDRGRIQPLVEALQADGYSVWWDDHIGAGDDWRRTIERQLDAARSVIVAWSKRSVGPNGRFVRDEASRAQARGVYVPVLIDAVKPPLGFGENQGTSLRGWKGDRADKRYESILASVRDMAGPPSGGQSQRSRPEGGVNRRAVLAGGAVATVAVAGMAGWALFKSGAASASDSIAVLPFANLSGDASQAYFSDGIAEELRNALSRISGLKVVGRTSSEAVRHNDAATAARKLGVGNILTGSVRQSPSTIRVSAQLVDGRNGIEKWSENYDRAPGDAIKIQTDIAESVANALRITLGVAGRAALSVGGTTNPRAQELVFRSRKVASRGGAADLKAALVLVDQAIALDPDYAEAVVQKALLLDYYANSYTAGTQQLYALRAEALRWANRAYALAPDFAGAQYALAGIHRNSLELRTALSEFQRALHLAPGDSAIVRGYADFVAYLGRAGEALRLADQAVTLDPLAPESHKVRVNVLNAQRQFQETIKYTNGIRQRSPDLFTWPVELAYALILLNRANEALEVLSDPAVPGNDPFSRSLGEAFIYARGGKRAEAEAKLALIKREYGDTASYQYGMVYSQFHDNDRAFAALDRAWEIRDSGLASMKIDAFLDPIRSDSRFDTLMRRIDFPA